MSVAIQMVEEKLAEVNKEIESKVGSLAEDRDQLIKDLKKLTRGTSTNGNAPAVPDEQLIKAVGSLTSGPDASPVKTTEIAKHLGVDSRTIARKLSKLSDQSLITGNKDDGYSA